MDAELLRITPASTLLRLCTAPPRRPDVSLCLPSSSRTRAVPVLPLTTTIASLLLPTRGPCVASFRVIKTNKFAYTASTLND